MCGSYFVAVVLVVYFLLPDREREAKLVREHGERVMAWIVPTKAFDMGKFYIVLVIYTFDKSIPNAAQFLEDVALRMVRINRRTAIDADEEEVAGWVEDVAGYSMILSRSQLPKSFTEGRDGYCIKTYAQKEWLPEGGLTVPFLYVQAHPDVPDVSVRMVPYPAAEDGSERRESLLVRR